MCKLHTVQKRHAINTWAGKLASTGITCKILNVQKQFSMLTFNFSYGVLLAPVFPTLQICCSYMKWMLTQHTVRSMKAFEHDMICPLQFLPNMEAATSTVPIEKLHSAFTEVAFGIDLQGHSLEKQNNNQLLPTKSSKEERKLPQNHA